jgi:mannose-6-phosphate isomerase
VKIENFGGNLIKNISESAIGKIVFASGPYEYFIYSCQKNETISFDKLNSLTIYILKKPNDTVVKVKGKSVENDIQNGDVIQIENCLAEISIAGEGVVFLAAGVTDSVNNKKIGIEITKFEDIYKVSKPWGHELWINKAHPHYVLKQVFIKAGTKTSLQYHNYKQETNVLFDGLGRLHYKKNTKVANDLVSDADLSTVELRPVVSIDVIPNILHRLEAISDITLYEASTPHLNDVVRIKDDNNRPDGRIESEHFIGKEK